MSEAHNVTVTKKLHIAPRNKFNMANSTRAHGLQTVKPAEQGMINANLTDLEHLEMTQYYINKWLKLFGETGAEAVIIEMTQLETMYVIKPITETKLTRTENEASLEYLMLLKHKRCWRIKGRGGDDRRKQRMYISKEDIS